MQERQEHALGRLLLPLIHRFKISDLIADLEPLLEDLTVRLAKVYDVVVRIQKANPGEKVVALVAGGTVAERAAGLHLFRSDRECGEYTGQIGVGFVGGVGFEDVDFPGKVIGRAHVGNALR